MCAETSLPDSKWYSKAKGYKYEAIDARIRADEWNGRGGPEAGPRTVILNIREMREIRLTRTPGPGTTDWP